MYPKNTYLEPFKLSGKFYKFYNKDTLLFKVLSSLFVYFLENLIRRQIFSPKGRVHDCGPGQNPCRPSVSNRNQRKGKGHEVPNGKTSARRKK